VPTVLDQPSTPAMGRTRPRASSTSRREIPREQRRPSWRARLGSAIAWALQIAAVLLFRIYLRLFHGLRIVGRQHLPLDRPFVLVANHTSHLDMFCLLAALPLRVRRRVFPLIARDYFRRAWTGLAVWTMNALPVDRRSGDRRSILKCERLLSAGNILILFPEGTRSAGDEPAEFRRGVAFLAAGRDIPVVPCYLAGSHTAWPKGRWLPRPAVVSLTIGFPLNYAELPRTRQGREELCRNLRSAVIRLAPFTPEFPPARSLPA
jgi:1-acyl-sn-glycerol-3-phosphate acyltransferase